MNLLWISLVLAWRMPGYHLLESMQALTEYLSKLHSHSVTLTAPLSQQSSPHFLLDK